MADVKIGDLVKYRDWVPGDQPVNSVPGNQRGWGSVGIVIGIEDWTIGASRHPGCGVLILDSSADFVLVRKSDVNIINSV